MSNPFSGIINSNLKTLFNNAISALLYDDSLTRACTLYYGVTKHEDCVNCVYDSIGRKSANRHQSGGPVPFPFGGICPMCNGVGKRAVETTEQISLMIIFDPKQFMNSNTVYSNEKDIIQTITFIENLPKLKRAKEIVVNTEIANYGRYRYERISDPSPCGWGNSKFVECIWKRSG